MWGDIAIAFLLATLTSFVITPYTIKLAKRVGAVDTPKDDRRINKISMTRLRWFSCYNGFCCINNLFTYCNEYRRKNQFNS